MWSVLNTIIKLRHPCGCKDGYAPSSPNSQFGMLAITIQTPCIIWTCPDSLFCPDTDRLFDLDKNLSE